MGVDGTLNFDSVPHATTDADPTSQVPLTRAQANPTAQADPDVQANLEGEAQPSNKRKNGSLVWTYFKKMKHADGSLLIPHQAKCTICGKVYHCESKGVGTSSMKKHIKDQCVNCPAYEHSKKSRTISFERTEDGQSKMVSIQFDKDVSRKFCIRMIIRDELPFSHVEGQGFIDFMRVTQPKFVPPSRRTVARGVLDLYAEEKNRMQSKLTNRRVSITTDHWTSIQNVNYMVITGHFIDDNWTIHKRILSFVEIPNHKGKTIGKLIESCLDAWGIEKIFTIVVDNASPNQVAVDYMREKIGNWNQLVMNGSFLHMRCCCHILNLIVKDGLEWLGSAVDAIRNCVKYIRSSPSRLEKFRKCAAQEKVEHKGGIVPLDVCTRWNSTYHMLDVAVKYKQAFIRIEDEDSQFDAYFQDKVGGNKREGPPRTDDWAKAARVLKFLKIFYDATLAFSGSSVLTANEPPIWMNTIVQALDECMNGDDIVLKDVAKAMKEKYDKYWGSYKDMNKALLIAVVLDPRYKLEYLQYFFSNIEKDELMVDLMVDEIKDILLALFSEYAGSDPIARAASEAATHPNSSGPDFASTEEDCHSASLQKFLKMRQEKKVVEIKNEVDKYLLKAAEDPSNKKFNVLLWWKEHADMFPVLSKIAKDIFAVPASTVASESAFSLGSRVVDPFRASLTPKMVQALVCTSDWLKASGFCFFKDPSNAEIELYGELENVEKGELEGLTGKVIEA